jgi:hypothetical protein
MKRVERMRTHQMTKLISHQWGLGGICNWKGFKYNKNDSWINNEPYFYKIYKTWTLLLCWNALWSYYGKRWWKINQISYQPRWSHFWSISKSVKFPNLTLEAMSLHNLGWDVTSICEIHKGQRAISRLLNVKCTCDV